MSQIYENNLNTRPRINRFWNQYINHNFLGSIIKKKIMEPIEDNICPIKQEQIEEYDIYMKCVCCKKNFFEEEIRDWLTSKALLNKTCPNCRAQWVDYNMYVNRN